MAFLLDTNACIRYLRDPVSPIRTHLAAVPVGDVYLCSVVLAELHRDAERSADPVANRAVVDTFAAVYRSLPFDDAAAPIHARVRVHLERAGRIIGPYDLLIAAIALAHGLTLVTHNTGEFSRVPALALVDWEIP